MEVEKSKEVVSTPPPLPNRRLPPPLPPRKASTLDKLKFEAALKSASEQSLETRSEGAPTPTSAQPLSLSDMNQQPLSGIKNVSPTQPIDNNQLSQTSNGTSSTDDSEQKPSTSEAEKAEEEAEKCEDIKLSKQDSLDKEVKANSGGQVEEEGRSSTLDEENKPQVEPQESKHSSPRSSTSSSTSSINTLDNVKESEQKRLSNTEKIEEIKEEKKQDEAENSKSIIPGN